MNSPIRREKLPRHLALGPYHSTHFRCLPDRTMGGSAGGASGGAVAGRETRQPGWQALPGSLHDDVHQYGAGSPLMRVSEKMRAVHRQRVKEREQRDAREAPSAVSPGRAMTVQGRAGWAPSDLGLVHRSRGSMMASPPEEGNHWSGFKACRNPRHQAVCSPSIRHLRVEEKLASFASTSEDVSMDVHMLGVKMNALAQTVAKMVSQSRRASPAKAIARGPTPNTSTQASPTPAAAAARRRVERPSPLSHAFGQYQAARSRWMEDKPQARSDSPDDPPGSASVSGGPSDPATPFSQRSLGQGRPQQIDTEPQHLGAGAQSREPSGYPSGPADYGAGLHATGTRTNHQEQETSYRTDLPTSTLSFSSRTMMPPRGELQERVARDSAVGLGAPSGQTVPYQQHTSAPDFWGSYRHQGPSPTTHPRKAGDLTAGTASGHGSFSLDLAQPSLEAGISGGPSDHAKSFPQRSLGQGRPQQIDTEPQHLGAGAHSREPSEYPSGPAYYGAGLHAPGIRTNHRQEETIYRTDLPTSTLSFSSRTMMPPRGELQERVARDSDVGLGAPSSQSVPDQQRTSAPDFWGSYRHQGPSLTSHRLEAGDLPAGTSSGHGSFAMDHTRPSLLATAQLGGAELRPPETAAEAASFGHRITTRTEVTSDFRQTNHLHSQPSLPSSSWAPEDRPLSAYVSPRKESQAEPRCGPASSAQEGQRSEWTWRLPPPTGQAGDTSLERSEDLGGLSASSEVSWTPVVAPLLSGFTWESQEASRRWAGNPLPAQAADHSSWMATPPSAGGQQRVLHYDEVFTTPPPRVPTASADAAESFGAPRYANLSGDSDFSWLDTPGGLDAPHYDSLAAAGSTSASRASVHREDLLPLQSTWQEEAFGARHLPESQEVMQGTTHRSHVSLADSLALPTGRNRGSTEAQMQQPSCTLVPYTSRQERTVSDPVDPPAPWSSALSAAASPPTRHSDDDDLHLHFYVPPSSARSSASNSRTTSRRQSLSGTPVTARAPWPPQPTDRMDGAIPECVLEDVARLAYRLGGIDE